MKIYGHRGASDQYPENTIIAYKHAIEKGADGISAEVHLTKDGQCVLIHDEMIDRVSNGSGWVKDMTYEKLLKYNFSQQKDVESWVKIPTLEQLLSLIKNTQIQLILEIKTDCIDYKGIEEKVVELVNLYQLFDKIVFVSMNIESLLKLKELNPNIKTGYLVERHFEDALIKTKHYGIESIHPRMTMLTDQLIQLAKQFNIELYVWYVNDKDAFNALKDYGVKYCITDKIKLLKSL